MKNRMITLFILVLGSFLAVFSFRTLNQNPITFFVLKNNADQMAAYKIDLYFVHDLFNLQPVALNSEQAIEANQIMMAKNLSDLEFFSKNFGHYHFVICFPNSSGSVIDCWNGFFRHETDDTFSNLNILDKIYLSLLAYPIQGTPSLTATTVGMPPAAVSPTAMVSTVIPLNPTSVDRTIVHVEILNGCGIRGASRWLAQQLKNNQIVAKNGGNANRFSYARSMVLSNAPVSRIFESACEKLGFVHLIIRKGVVPPGYDLVFIVGKDFRNVRRK